MAMCWHSLFTIFIYFCILSFSSVEGRKHHLTLKDDMRAKFPVSTFGFYVGGTLKVSLNLTYTVKNLKKLDLATFGFTLDKTMGNGAMSGYFEENDKNCALRQKGKDVLGSDQAVSTVLIEINMTSKALSIQPIGKDISNLKISPLDLMQVKPTIETPTNVTVVDSTTTISTTNIAKGNSSSSNNTVVKRSVPSVEPSPTDVIPVTVNVKENVVHVHTEFAVFIRNQAEEGLFNLYFHNCNNTDRVNGIKIDADMEIEEKNPTSFLSAGEMPMPTMYFVLCVMFFLTGCFWLYVVRTSSDGVYKMHYLMLVLVYVKGLSFMFHGINYHFIGKYGIHEEAWAVLYYITHLMKGSLLFLTIVLIGTGWTLIKHMLTERDKKIFLVVIPLQILANVAKIIIDETEEGDSLYTTFKIVLFLVDLLCCGAILFPVIGSIRHLQEASHTDGKAAINLQKLKLFRQFYIMIVCYIYFTRIIVYLVQMVMTFMYSPWLNELLKELCTFILFIVTGSKFRPASNNPYLQVPTDDEDDIIEMEEVLTKSGAFDTLTKVNQTGNSETSTMKQRESSHEYD